MTISTARLNANRRNSLRSKGPVSEAGKARVRMNAWKHGLRAESDAVAPDEAGAVAARREAWGAAFPTGEDAHRRWLVDQLTLASVRIDRCQEHQRHQAGAEADRAAGYWDVDRAAEAATLGARLAKDPDRVVSQLCRTVAGVDWLLARWRGLADLLERDGSWDDAQRRLCLDLMQVDEPFRASDLRMLANLPPGELRDLVADYTTGLESSRESAAGLDEANRGLAEIGLPTYEGSELRRLRRYESALWRRYRSLEASWKADRAAGPASDADEVDLDADPIGDLIAYSRLLDPAPEFDPGPEPEPVPPPSEPPPRPGPPGPRPDRNARRAPDRPAPTAPTAPVAPGPIARPTPTEPSVIATRRARRRALKRARAGKGSSGASPTKSPAHTSAR